VLRVILIRHLTKAILFTLIALILYGILPGTHLAGILITFCILRLIYILAEAFRKPIPQQQWEAVEAAWVKQLEQSDPEVRAEMAAELNLAGEIPARELAHAKMQRVLLDYRPPRRKLELVAEVLGLMAFGLILPIVIALYSRDFFSLRTPQGWMGTAVVALCVALYAWPHFWIKPPRFVVVRSVWWALPFLPALQLLVNALDVRHPYLNPLHPERTKLEAERVLALKNNIIAGRHADWVSRYAEQLDANGDAERAIQFYREALRLDPNNRVVSERVAQLEGHDHVGSIAVEARVSPTAPYWAAGEPFTKSPRRKIDAELEQIEECTVVLVPVGDPLPDVLDATCQVIRKELGLPALVFNESVPLPPPSRVRGLVTGQQWDQASLTQAVVKRGISFPKAPVKYVLITPVDIYGEEANFVFSVSYEWGAVVSYARFKDGQGDSALVCHRAAKQTLCALIKSFKVPISTDRNCVTSYSRSLEEFDLKANRPNPPTLALFRQAVALENAQWQAFKNQQRLSATPTIAQPAK
jgi:predicted Zn-dependent protease/tetratricopeptide (TPR) repeat protein